MGQRKPATVRKRARKRVATADAEVRRLRRMVRLYEAGLRWIIESARDRRALNRNGSGSAFAGGGGELSAYTDMAQVALHALRNFHPDEPSVDDYLGRGTRVPDPPAQLWNILKRGR